MQNLLNGILLISSIFTCLALGVALAYGLCNLMFAGMRLREVKPRVTGKVAGVAQV